MHPRLQRQVRILDRWEREFLAAVRKLLAARVNALEPVVKAALEPGGEKVIEKLGRLRALPGDYLPLLERYVGHLLVEGMVQGRSDVEFLRSRLQRRGVRLAARVDGEPVVPEEAIDFIRHRRDLGRFFEQDQVDTVRTILDNGLQEGATVKQVMDALRIALPEAIGKARAENIARTEATTAFNQGRMAAFRETKGFVGAVEFMAITDARTTPICMERDGLVLAIDDPRLPDNTPPLHYMCRSVLSPVSGLELEDLGGKNYLDKQREKLDKLPPPLKGFGNDPGLDGGRPPGQPPVVRTPRGPKVGTEGEARLPEDSEGVSPSIPGENTGKKSLDAPRISVDYSPDSSDKPSGERPPVPPGPIAVPPGLVVSYAPGLSDQHPVVREALYTLSKMDSVPIQKIQDAGVRVVFDDRNLFWILKEQVRFRDNKLELLKALFLNRSAAKVSGVPKPDGTTIFFRPNVMARRGTDTRWATLHESGHVVADLEGLVNDPAAVAAYEAEKGNLPRSFRKGISEFLAQGFAFHRYSSADAGNIGLLAPLLAAIVRTRMAHLASDVHILWQGPEGHALVADNDSRIVFALKLGKEVEMGHIFPDGRVESFGGGSIEIAGLKISWPEQWTWKAKKSSRLKAFLRSKGVTLPHVTK